MPLRVYTGPQATVFTGIGPVTPGVPFNVPDRLLEGLDRRPDITVPRPPRPAPAPAPEASEDASRSQEADTSGAGPSGRRGRSGSPTGKNGTGDKGGSE